MKHASETIRITSLPLPRILIFLLAGGFANLLIDLRAEHVDVVHERSVAWLPIVYSAVMMLACSAAAFSWTEFARSLLLPLFLLGIVVGIAGFYFHNDGNVLQVVRMSISAWTDATMSHPQGPPPLAPLAFAGLGLFGAILTLERFNVEPVQEAPQWEFTRVPCGDRGDCLHCRHRLPVLSPARR